IDRFDVQLCHGCSSPRRARSRYASRMPTPDRWRGRCDTCSGTHRARSSRELWRALSAEARRARLLGFERKVVVVAGASAGLGRAIGRAVAVRGAPVGLIARGLDGLEAARAEVESMGGRALVLPLDVADAEAVDAAAERVERE